MQGVKVLQICAVDFTVKHFLLPLIDAMLQEGYDVTICCSAGPFTQELRQKGYKVENIEISRSLNLFAHLISLLKVYRFMRRQRFDVVHAHTPIASLIARLAAWLARVPLILYTAHGFYFHENMNKGWRFFHILLERAAGRMSDFIFTQSQEDALTAIKEGIVSKEKILWIGNGVDVERFNHQGRETEALQRRVELGLGPSCPVVGTMGRLVREKGFREFFQAGQRVKELFPDCQFLVVGDALESDYDSFKTEIKALIEELGLTERVVFMGFRSDIPELLDCMDVFVLASYREGMPRSIIEAMAMSKPVVATNIRGCREEVVDGKTGFLVPMKDPEALSKAIMKLLKNKDLAKTMGIEGRKRAEEVFSEKKVIQRQLEVMEKLIREKGIKGS